MYVYMFRIACHSIYATAQNSKHLDRSYLNAFWVDLCMEYPRENGVVWCDVALRERWVCLKRDLTSEEEDISRDKIWCKQGKTSEYDILPYECLTLRKWIKMYFGDKRREMDGVDRGRSLVVIIRHPFIPREKIRGRHDDTIYTPYPTTERNGFLFSLYHIHEKSERVWIWLIRREREREREMKKGRISGTWCVSVTHTLREQSFLTSVGLYTASLVKKWRTGDCCSYRSVIVGCALLWLQVLRRVDKFMGVITFERQLTKWDPFIAER
jgi:hypothetical protein